MSGTEVDFERNAVSADPLTPALTSSVLAGDAVDAPKQSPEESVRRAKANAAMDRYAMGDDAAFDELYDALVPRLLPYATRRAGDAVRGEDLVQQTLLQMHLARASFRSGSDVLSWAFAIVTRLAIDGFRRRRNEVLSDDPHAAMGPTALSTGGPDHDLGARQVAAIVERALDGLPEGQREAYDLVRGEGFSPAEAAAILGTTQNAVNLRVHRAYDALRAALAAAEKEA
jgi:RNA polymerase sigma-70 factor (ECF subfamily)